MSISIKPGNTLLVIISLLVSQTTISSSLGDSIVGTYKGKLRGSGDRSIVTEFSLDSNGRISGAFTLKEKKGETQGEFYNCTEKIEKRKVRCNWKDKLGNGVGVMNIKFSEDYESFLGGWNFEGSSQIHPWDGKK
jgi:hypothetical protein